MNESLSNEILDKIDAKVMLEFEMQVFLDIIHKDGLVITSKGLNMDLVIFNILKVYCDPGNLVLVLNASDNEEKYFKEKLNDPHVHIINATSNSVTEREDVYLSGGITFVSTRILVVDMLKKRIPIEKITGFVVLRAHTIFESCQEALVLRLYRQNNKTGFVKAFSSSAQSFTVGFGHVERVMHALFVKELYIWPRFHSLVVKSFKEHEPTVIELHIPISEKMKKIQTCVLEIMNLTVKELKRINKGVELQEITVENCLTKKFHKILQAQLNVIWHQLSRKSLQLIEDLKILRHLIITMFYSDPVTFYSTVMKYRTMEYAKHANWVFLEPAEMLFSQVQAFVFNKNKELDPDFCPKWKSLLEILKVEIPAQMKKIESEQNTILIFCSDYRTCHQLNEILTNGPSYYLLDKVLANKITFKNMSQKFKGQKIPPKLKPTTIDTKKLKLDKPSDSETHESDTEPDEIDFQSSYILTMSQTILEKDPNSGDPDLTFEPFSQMENMNLTQLCASVKEPTIIIQTFKPSGDFINIQHSLETLKPIFIVMYHCSMTAVREIEMYEAHKQNDTPLFVYFLLHAETVEEQSYLTTLRREKECFEYLIDRKATMVIPEDQDGKTEQCAALQRIEDEPVKNTREGGKTKASSKQVVIVDIREFRSDLPALIHKRGMEIEPLTITIGDYILTPEICIERKSLSDLIGSLRTGRLYQQCTQMSRFYSKPMLLIEFDQNKQFGWQDAYMLSSDSKSFDVQQKLLLLTIHFPKLKIIWSPSPYASAQLFEELKAGRDNPNVEYAAAIGETDLDLIETKYNSATYDFVQKLPGITSKNIDCFLRSVGNLENATKKTEDELNEILGNSEDARLLYSILHDQHKPEVEEQVQKSKFKGRPRYIKK